MAGAVYLLDGSTGGLLRTFSSPDPTEHVRFGHSLAAVGANVLVGSPDGDPTDSGGVAYLLDAGTGAPLLTLNDPHGTWHYDGSYFGLTVAAHGGNLLVGGESHSVSAGVVRFDGRTGAQLTRYMYPGFDPSDGFGYTSIAAGGDHVLVGAAGVGPGRGVYLFDATTAELLLTVHDPGVGTNYGTAFGYRVVPFGRDILISAPGDDSDGKDFGRVYLFQGVPEPATLALVAVAGAAAVLVLLRRRPEGARDRARSVSGTGSVNTHGIRSFVGRSRRVLTSKRAYTSRGGNFMFGSSFSKCRYRVRQPLLSLTCAVAWVAYAVVAHGAPGDVVRVFQDPNPGPLNWFGASMAVSGDRILIGAPYTYATGQGDGGAAYLFDSSTGALLRTFWNPEPSGGGHAFGYSTAAFGSNFLIGGPDCGVDLFDGSTGELLRRFQDPMPTGDDRFGTSVAALGSNVLVGDPGDSALGPVAGAVYLLDGSTGNLLRTFSSPDPTHHAWFGQSVAAARGNLLVGSPDGDPTESDGVAYLFDGGTGDLLLTLNDPQGPWHYHGSYFGRAVAVRGDDMIVGGYPLSEEAGVFRFDGTTGVVLSRFMYPGFDPSDAFGYAIAVVGDDVLAGAPGLGDRQAYLFHGETGELQLTLRNPGDPYGSYSGASVAGFGRDILIAGSANDGHGGRTGAVFLVQGVPEPSMLALLGVGGVAALRVMCRRRGSRDPATRSDT
jgi:hypothetical protein